MSQETMEWLNENILFGFCELGRAWHDDPSLRESLGIEDNHYIGAIDPNEVIRRLFNFTVHETSLYVPVFDENGAGFAPVEGRKAMTFSDTGKVAGIFKDGFKGHDYTEWLLGILADLPIGSAGLLKDRCQAFVQFRMPENVNTPQGVTFAPFIGACTSFDGSLASTFKDGVTLWQCDNTMSAGLSEQTQTVKVKHTKYSSLDRTTEEVRSMLQVVERTADAFAAEIARLCAIEVSAIAFDAIMDKLVPIPEADLNKRGNTVATTKANTIRALYNSDDRCEPWKGTGFGVLQAFNTYALHEASVRKGADRTVRNMENFVSGKLANHDDAVIKVLELVTN
jgi:phage/plasmid-like protein (TIGR03299 family)